MKSIGEILLLAARFLKERGVEHPRRDVEELLASFLRCKRLDLYLHFDLPLEEKELEALRNAIKRRAKGEPLQYILGEMEFFGAQFLLSPAVLIPRPETEILVSIVAKCFCANEAQEQSTILWDLCCGSGVIGISLKKKFPWLTVVLSDLSKDALAIADQNANKNQVEVTLLAGDLFAPLVGKRADLIICNPPYISAGDFAQISPSVRDFEPKLALVGGEDGLVFYRRLAGEAPAFLNPGGRLYLEIGYDQGEAVSKIFSHEPWKAGRLEQDWAGKDRFFFVEI